MAEGQARIAARPADVEGVRLGKRPAVPVGRAHGQQHGVSGANGDPADLDVAARVPGQTATAIEATIAWLDAGQPDDPERAADRIARGIAGIVDAACGTA
ncbi:hypothetical protein GTS_49940 [Gandjariella thermophila]|uniref:Uncharacterized protein n=1 Tax=Gandjariella thermophila TaxID=1931992 RepID=A0A4D4J9L9_9PSEU|nr:hypothetical protein GTS_49940 [Gandjariella thermophila]